MRAKYAGGLGSSYGAGGIAGGRTNKSQETGKQLPEQPQSQTSTHKPDTLRGGGGEGGGWKNPIVEVYSNPPPPNEGLPDRVSSVLLSPISVRAMWSVKNCIPEEYNGLPKVEAKSMEAVHFSDPCAL